MGSKPSTQSRELVKTWTVRVKYVFNGHKCDTTISDLSAPTESEAVKALYDKHGTGSVKIENVEICQQFPIYKHVTR